jgi:hypothetical protein
VPEQQPAIQRCRKGRKPVAEPIRIKPGDGLIETVEARGKTLSAPELADVAGFSPEAIYEDIRTGKLPAVKRGTTYSICPKAAGQYLREHRTVKPQEPQEPHTKPERTKSRAKKKPPL